VTDPDRRAVNPELIHRIDQQDALLREIRDMVVLHIENEKAQVKAIEDLIIIWRGSKIIIPALAALFGILGTLYVWAKDHIK
jgi:hypothetical protein